MASVRGHATVRNGLGQFIADVEGAAAKVRDEALQVGIDAARAETPVRTGEAAASFQTQIVSRTLGYFFNPSKHFLWIDEGVDEHLEPADVSFFWEEEGRMWEPDTTGTQNINHPGQPAQHILDKGNAAMKAALPGITKKWYGAV